MKKFYVIEKKANGSASVHVFESENKYKFFIGGNANSTSEFEPCDRETAKLVALGAGAFYMHPCGGPRHLTAASEF